MIMTFALVATGTIWAVNHQEEPIDGRIVIKLAPIQGDVEPSQIIVCTHPLNPEYIVSYPASDDAEATLGSGDSREVLDVNTGYMTVLRGEEGWTCE